MCDVLPTQHVTAEGSALVKQAEDAAINKKVCSLPKKFAIFFDCTKLLSNNFTTLNIKSSQ